MRMKYRFWDRVKGEWFKPTYEAYKGNLEDLFLDGTGQILRHTINGIEHESLFPDRYEPVFYTGLRDKNGKEIYESDIVRWYGPAHKVYMRQVVFERGTFHVGNIADGLCDYPDFEVIGNIYENPELLESREASAG